jgi:hypothetical protein
MLCTWHLLETHPQPKSIGVRSGERGGQSIDYKNIQLRSFEFPSSSSELYVLEGGLDEKI